MADESIPRRRFLQGAGAVGTAVATALSTARDTEAQTVPPTERASNSQSGVEPLLTLTATEAAFLGAAYDAIIPSDRLSPSGSDCGLVNYIDRQLAAVLDDLLGFGIEHADGVAAKFCEPKPILRIDPPAPRPSMGRRRRIERELAGLGVDLADAAGREFEGVAIVLLVGVDAVDAERPLGRGIVECAEFSYSPVAISSRMICERSEFFTQTLPSTFDAATEKCDCCVASRCHSLGSG
jgi:hypothetical protein